MEKKWLLLGVVVVVCLCGVNALAFDPMGAPAASLKQGKFNGSLEYSCSNMDLKLTGGKYKGSYWHTNEGVETEFDSAKLRSTTLSAQMNKIYANLGYGITDNWEAFIRLGGASGNFDWKRQETRDANDVDAIEIDNDFTFAYGFGTKVTLWEQSPELKWGGLFQMSWAKWSNTTKSKSYERYPPTTAGVYYPDGVSSESLEINVNEIQIAAGPTWTPSQGVSIYGGPFLHFVYGDLENKEKGTNYYEGIATSGGSEKSSYDISEDSCFGGYIGAQVQLGENAFVSVEYMTTGDASAFGASAVWPF